MTLLSLGKPGAYVDSLVPRAPKKVEMVTYLDSLVTENPRVNSDTAKKKAGGGSKKVEFF